jgi:hypothetical protein
MRHSLLSTLAVSFASALHAGSAHYCAAPTAAAAAAAAAVPPAAVQRPHPAAPLRRRSSQPLLQLTSASPDAPPLHDVPTVDWSFIDAAYLITCPQADGSNPRLASAWRQLEAVGLAPLTEVAEFGTDDEDRIRGCYTSHITVLEAAAARFADRPADEELNVLVLEDNLSISPRIAQPTLDAIAGFLSKTASGGALGARDMVHLAYIMYVPGLSVAALPQSDHIVRLQCNADSVLGTTAYVISRSGLDALLAEHRRAGYVDAIPNVMARLFPDS